MDVITWAEKSFNCRMIFRFGATTVWPSGKKWSIIRNSYMKNSKICKFMRVSVALIRAHTHHVRHLLPVHENETKRFLFVRHPIRTIIIKMMRHGNCANIHTKIKNSVNARIGRIPWMWSKSWWATQNLFDLLWNAFHASYRGIGVFISYLCAVHNCTTHTFAYTTHTLSIPQKKTSSTAMVMCVLLSRTTSSLSSRLTQLRRRNKHFCISETQPKRAIIYRRAMCRNKQ